MVGVPSFEVPELCSVWKGPLGVDYIYSPKVSEFLGGHLMQSGTLLFIAHFLTSFAPVACFSARG